MKKKDVFVSIIKGVITGFAALIPGVSPASIVFSLSSYDNFLFSLSSFNNSDKKLTRVTIPLIIGMIVGIGAGAYLFDILFNKYTAQTILFFTGLMFGGILLIVRNKKINVKVKDFFLVLIIFSLSIGIYLLLNDKSLLISKYDLLNTIVLGAVTVISLIIPPVSVSYFNSDVIKLFSTGLNIFVFIVVLVLLLVLIAKLVYKLFSKNSNCFYLMLCTLVFSNIIIAFLQITKFNLNFVNVFTSLLAFLWGYLFSKNVIKE